MTITAFHPPASDEEKKTIEEALYEIFIKYFE